MWFAVISAAFLLGVYFGNNKFDAEKLRLHELVSKEAKSIDSLKNIKATKPIKSQVIKVDNTLKDNLPKSH